MLPDRNIYALCDFETTGVDTEKDSPIEVAVLFCDHRLDVVGAVESLVRYQFPVDVDGGVIDGSEEHYRKAEKIHGIPTEVLADAPSYRTVADRIRFLCGDLVERSAIADRVVLLSDNIQFEWKFMEELMGGVLWPFHYCGWDTSLLLEATGVGDPEMVHRAMADVGRIHTALRKALAKVSRNECGWVPAGGNYSAKVMEL